MSPSLQSRITQADWSEGEVRDVVPELISPAGAYAMTNLLLDEDGNPYLRGGASYLSGTGLGTAGLTWCWDGFLGPGARTMVANAADFGALSSDDSEILSIGGEGLPYPKQAAVLKNILYVGGGHMWAGSRKSTVYGTGTGSVTKGSKAVTGSGTTWNTLVDAGMLLRVEAGDGRVYVVEAINSTTSLTLQDPYEGATETGRAYTLNPVYRADSKTDPYEQFEYVTTCANRWVFARGRKIKFTAVNNPHSFLSSLGTVNEHEVPEGVEITGLSTVGNTTLVSTTGGVWTLEGLPLEITDLNGNSQHKLQRLTGDIVLAGSSGIASYGQSLVVPAGDGVYLMDGISTPRRISKPIERPYRQLLKDDYRIGGAFVFNSHYFLPFLLSGSNRVKAVYVCRLDRPTSDRDQTIYPWSQMAGDGGRVACYVRRAARDPQQPRLLGTQTSAPSRLLDCSGYFTPARGIEHDGDGTAPTLELVTRAYPTGAETVNRVRAILPLYELFVGSESPKLQFSYNDGTAKPTGPTFGSGVKFGSGVEFGGTAGGWTPIGELGPSDGRDPGRLPVNKKARHIRYRIRSVGATPMCAIRSFTQTIRPSEAIRR
jgi:hypothetical protein